MRWTTAQRSTALKRNEATNECQGYRTGGVFSLLHFFSPSSIPHRIFCFGERGEGGRRGDRYLDCSLVREAFFHALKIEMEIEIGIFDRDNAYGRMEGREIKSGTDDEN
jgi:hypothetical protein